MADRILLPGFRDDIPQLAKACDLMVLPSLREGLPRGALESLANGTPVITSANAGAMELITDNENGFVVPLQDGKAIAEKIRYLHEQPKELERLAANALRGIETTFSHGATVASLELYFSALIDQPA